jgi:chromosome segregation ATPase
LTLLEKWRRKAFELTKQLVAMEVSNEKDRANFQAMEASILKQIEDKNAKIKATEQENRRLEDETKHLESEVTIGQRHVDSLESKLAKARAQCSAVIHVVRRHRSWRPTLPSKKYPFDHLQHQIHRLRTLAFPKHPQPNTDLELKYRRLSEKLREKDRQKEERLAAISIFQKVATFQKKYRQLQTQMKGIEEEVERANAERRQEQELRGILSKLQETGQKRLAEEEAKLRTVYESKRRERDGVLRKKTLLMNEIDELKRGVVNARENLQNELREKEDTLRERKAEIERLKEVKSEMQRLQRFDKEVACSLAEEVQVERVAEVRVDSPRRAPPGSGASPSQLKVDAIARLQELMQAAQQTAREHEVRSPRRIHTNFRHPFHLNFFRQTARYFFIKPL